MEIDYSYLSHDPLKFAAAADAAGRNWIRELPTLLASACERWSLEPDGTPSNGYHAVVIPVRRGSLPCAVKCEWPAEHADLEARALTVWNGFGAVELLDEDREKGILLLERLHESQSLSRLPLFEAAAELGKVLRALTVPAPCGFPPLTDVLAQIEAGWRQRQLRLGKPVPDGIMKKCRTVVAKLTRGVTTKYLVHADLHYDNVLRRSRNSWAAIDPKPIAGDPEFSVPEMLWTRADEVTNPEGFKQLLRTIVAEAQLDADKARQWAIVRSIDYWLWGLEAALNHDPARCRRVIEALLD